MMEKQIDQDNSIIQQNVPFVMKLDLTPKESSKTHKSIMQSKKIEAN